MPILGKGKKDDPIACMQQGKFKEAIKLLEAKLNKDPQNFAMKVKLAEAYEGDNRKADAAAIYVREAEERIGAGNRSDGMALLKKASRLTPDDDSLCARIVKLERSSPEPESEEGSFSFDVGGEEPAPEEKAPEGKTPEAPPEGVPAAESGEPPPIELEVEEEIETAPVPAEAPPGEAPGEPSQIEPRVERAFEPAPVLAETAGLGPQASPGVLEAPAEPVPAEAVFVMEPVEDAEGSELRPIEMGPPEEAPAAAEAVVPAVAVVEPNPLETAVPAGEILLGEPPPEEFDLVPFGQPADHAVAEGGKTFQETVAERESAVVLTPLSEVEQAELIPLEEATGPSLPAPEAVATPPQVLREGPKAAGAGEQPVAAEAPAAPVAVVAVDDGGGAEVEALLVPVELEAVEPAPGPAPEEDHETPWDYVQMLFPELAPEQLKAVHSVTRPIDLPQGHVLVREGEEGDSLFIVTRGRLEARGRFEGKEIPLATFTAGDILGEVAFLKRVPRTATVTALEPSTVLEMQGELTRRELSVHPGLLGQLEIILQERVYKTLSVLKNIGKKQDGNSQD